MKLIHEGVGNSLELIGICKNFFYRTPAAQKLIKDKWNFMKLKSSCTTKEMVCKLKKPHIKWKKIFASYTSD
jgi:hypothetical protein